MQFCFCIAYSNLYKLLLVADYGDSSNKLCSGVAEPVLRSQAHLHSCNSGCDHCGSLWHLLRFPDYARSGKLSTMHMCTVQAGYGHSCVLRNIFALTLSRMSLRCTTRLS